MAEQVNQSIHEFERINMIMDIENRFSNPPGVSNSNKQTNKQTSKQNKTKQNKTKQHHHTFRSLSNI
jgi:hypothetical protein